MKVFNPTGWTIEGGAHGQPYKVEAFSELDIYDIWHVNHLLQSLKRKGLVSLEYGPKAQEKYPTFEEYKTAQEISGLKQILKTKEQCLRDERQAERDLKERKGGEGYKALLNSERFMKEIALIKSWIAEAGGTITKKADAFPVVAKRPDWNEKTEVAEKTETGNLDEKKDVAAPRRGRPRSVRNESRGNAGAD